ncbi:MAG: histidine phosphatase family protein [Nanoarchaeota archaeon]|nr:histidine phosphatase family protein [Nanoarchaeota archaeon]
MKIYLIRHGESEGNRLGINQGQKNDFPLTENGRDQSSRVAERLAKEKICAIYSSDLRRAKETAEIICSPHKLIPILDERLRERDFGDLGDKKDLLKNWKEYVKENEKRGIKEEDVVPPNGESDKNHWNRVNSFFEDIKLNHNSEDAIIVVAHGGTNKVTFGVIDPFTKAEMYKIPQGNTCVNELIFENGRWEVKFINCMKHIEIESDILSQFILVRDEPLNVIKNRCWEKHIKLKKIFDNKGYKTKYGICSFNWSEQKLPKEITNLHHDDLDYHLFLTVNMNGLKMIVDASNDSLLPLYNAWEGKSNCNLCVVPKEFIEEGIEDMICKKINEDYSEDQSHFLTEVNSFFEDLRKNKSTPNKKE